MSSEDTVEGSKSGGIMLHNTISSLYDANVNQTALHEDVMKKLERMDEKMDKLNVRMKNTAITATNAVRVHKSADSRLIKLVSLTTHAEIVDFPTVLQELDLAEWTDARLDNLLVHLGVTVDAGADQEVKRQAARQAIGVM